MKQFDCRAVVEDVAAQFAWDLPAHFNLGVACSDVHPQGAIALTHIHEDGKISSFTFGDVSTLSRRVANMLRGFGLGDGDRVAVNLSQDPATAIVNLGTFKANLISVPLSKLFGPTALQYRLRDSSAKSW